MILPNGKMPGTAPNPADVDRMFAKIGRVASAFGSLELALDEYLADLINSQSAKIGPVVLTKMNSFKTKVQLFGKLILLRMGLSEQPANLKELCKQLDKASDRRNDVVHSTYLGISGERDKLHQRWPPGRSRIKIEKGEKKAIDYGVYTISEVQLENTIDTIENVQLLLLTFMEGTNKSGQLGCS